MSKQVLRVIGYSGLYDIGGHINKRWKIIIPPVGSLLGELLLGGWMVINSWFFCSIIGGAHCWVQSNLKKIKRFEVLRFSFPTTCIA